MSMAARSSRAPLLRRGKDVVLVTPIEMRADGQARDGSGPPARFALDRSDRPV